jgi:hypothetical protein
MDNVYKFLRQLDAAGIGLELADGDQLKMVGGSNLTPDQRAHIIANRGAVMAAIKAQLVTMGEMLNRVEQATTWSGLEQVVAEGYEAWKSGKLQTAHYERVTVAACNHAREIPPSHSIINNAIVRTAEVNAQVVEVFDGERVA